MLGVACDHDAIMRGEREKKEEGGLEGFDPSVIDKKAVRLLVNFWVIRCLG